jgi:hypothetical protein
MSIVQIHKLRVSQYDRKKHRGVKTEPETVRQWLEKIPWGDIAAKAIANTDGELLQTFAPEETSCADELASAFVWDETSEGRGFWLKWHGRCLYWQYDYEPHD